MAPSTSLVSRDGFGYSASSKSGLPTMAIIGFVVAGIILAIVGGWLGVRLYRKRAQRKRDNARGAAFLSVRGLVKEDGSDPEKASAAA